MQEIIQNLLMTYHLPALFAGAALFGETVILTAAFLAAQGWWSLAEVFWISLFGTVVSDAIWFLLGQYVTSTKKWAKHEKKYEKVVTLLNKKIGNRPYLSLLAIKFLYGTRILTIIYLSLRKISFWKFVFFDTLGTLIWLSVVVGIGWLAGKGYKDIISVFHNIGYALSALLVFFIMFRIVSIWLSKKITEK